MNELEIKRVVTGVGAIEQILWIVYHPKNMNIYQECVNENDAISVKRFVENCIAYDYQDRQKAQKICLVQAGLEYAGQSVQKIYGMFGQGEQDQNRKRATTDAAGQAGYMD